MYPGTPGPRPRVPGAAFHTTTTSSSTTTTTSNSCELAAHFPCLLHTVQTRKHDNLQKQCPYDSTPMDGP
eukprot:1272206-Rhodomonas_salina.1